MQSIMAHIFSNGLSFALLAGLFAALASVFAKIAFDSNFILLCLCGRDQKNNSVVVDYLESKPIVIMTLFKCKNVRKFL